MQFYQNSNAIFHRSKLKSIEIIWKHKRVLIEKAILNKQNKTEDITLSDLKFHTKL